MREYLALIVAGISDGSVLAIAAMGLVLSYKASGIFNFAQGAIGAAAAALFYQLHDVSHVPVALAILLTLLVAGVGFGMVMERVAHLVASASTTMKVVATIGIMVSLTSLINLRFGGQTQTFPSFLPSKTFALLGVNVGYDQVIIILVGVACAIGMTLFFQRTLLGRGMRAIVDDAQLVGLVGLNPTMVRRWAWIIGTTFASIAGILIAPSIGLDGTTLTLLVIASFAAAAIGRFSSLPLTFAGAIAIEVAVSLSTKLSATHSSLQNLPSTLPFAVLFLVLLFSPKRWLVEVGASLQQRVVTIPEHTRKAAAAKLLPVVVFVALVPVLFESHMIAWTNWLVFAILMMSLSLIVRLSNQISLCQFSFAAVGAVAAYKLTSLGLPWVLGLFGAGLIAIPIGAFVAIPAVRLSGVYLALATLSFGMVLESGFYDTSLMFGSSPIPLVMPRPSFAMSNSGYFYLVAAVGAICYAIVRSVERARLGQMLRCKADSPTALAALGINISLLPFIAFCVAAFLAGIAGALLGPVIGVVSGSNFETFPTSLLLVALLVLGGRNPRIGTLGASLGGAFGLIVIPAYISSYHVLQSLNLFFGVATVEAAVASTRSLKPGAALPSWPWRRVSADGAATEAATQASPDAAAEPVIAAPKSLGVRSDTLALTVRGLTVRYGGILAVDDVDLDVPPSGITGLIGPNGAGKTSLFNACAGVVRAASGTVELFGADVSHRSPARRAHAGLGRTFQLVQLFNTLTVRDNVAMGHEAAYAWRRPYSLLRALPSERRETKRVSDEILELCGISEIASRIAGSLSTGEKRMVELARVLASPARLLLLDEPSSGLSAAERAHFADILFSATGALGRAVLLIEHDMDLVARLCTNVNVLNFGRRIFSGSMRDAIADEAVQRSYLGESSLTAQASAGDISGA